MDSEKIYKALFDLVSSVSDFQTSGRKLKHWADVSPAEQPAMFMTQRHQEPLPISRGLPSRWLLAAEVYIYITSASDDTDGPAPKLNVILDALREVLSPDNQVQGEVQTLGGLVHYARIEGRIETDEGTLGNQAVAIVPIVMLTTH